MTAQKTAASIVSGKTVVKREKVTRTKLKDRVLPDYLRGEEIFNMVSHIVGGGFGIIALTLSVIFAAIHKNVWGIVSGSVYGFSMIMLYTISSVYHGLKPIMAKKVMQVIDHCTIYFFIAGTYTPILLTGLREYSPVLAWVIFGVVWGTAALAVTLTAIDLKKYRVFSMICYLVLGWCIITAVVPLIRCYGLEFFIWLLSGGVVYTIGAILYMIAGKGGHRYMHSVFHLFVLAGSISQFVGILKFCM